MKIAVYKNNVEKALKILKRKMMKEGVLKEIRQKSFYEKPSEKKKRKQREAQVKRKRTPRG